MEYKKRVIDGEIQRLLKISGAIVLVGPKAVGKTETASRYAKRIVHLDTNKNDRALAKADPALLLEGEKPLLIDEWQVEKEVWNVVRRAADASKEFGEFILTGSAVLTDDDDTHTGADRMRRLSVRPMTLFEKEISTGKVSISELFDEEFTGTQASGLTLNDMIEQVCTGGWPRFTSLSPNDAQENMQAYLKEITHTDIQRVDGVKRDPKRIGRVLRSYARHISTQVNTSTIVSDVYRGSEADNLKTINGDLNVLERLMIIEELPAWSPHLRSRNTLRKSATRHFIDPCLATAMLGASPSKLLRDLNSFGFLFESFVLRDLRVYSQPLRAELSHYRDDKDLEVDIIIVLPDGRWAGVEVKLGTAWIDEGAANLLKMADRVDPDINGAPTFLAVVTTSGSAYKRQDGVLVLPIGVLGP
jgi:predicted AAA+ superfamily ATPase